MSENECGVGKECNGGYGGDAVVDTVEESMWILPHSSCVSKRRRPAFN